MPKPRVIVTRPIPEAGLKILKDRFEVTVHPDRVMSVVELKKAVKGADALVSLLTDPIIDEVMAAAGPQLKVISQFAVGFDNIDVEAAQRRGITVTNTPGTLSAPAVAEHSFNLMLGASRHVVQADAFMRHGKYKQWDPNLFTGIQLSGKTVGIFGTGQIGAMFAAMCHNGLKMKVLYCDIARNENLERDLGAVKVTKERLLVEADVVSLHVPLMEGTRHLIGEAELAMMKNTAILVNTARGPIVHEKALVKALKKRTIYAAGIDVFEGEPKMADGLAELDNVVLSPHIGSATQSARNAMAECVARNVIAALSGETPPNALKI